MPAGHNYSVRNSLLNSRRVENGMVKRRSPEIVITKITSRNCEWCKIFYFKLNVRTKQVHHLLTFLVARSGGLVLTFCCQLLFQAAFTITMHHGLIPVLAKIFSDVIFIGIVFGNNYNLTKGLQQYPR